MIDKKISVSEQVANLPITGQLIFTWSIPHADDLGLLTSSLMSLRATIAPLITFKEKEFEKHINQIIDNGLYEIFEWDGEKYLRIIKFLDNQTLKKDRKPNTLLKGIESWNDVPENILDSRVIHMEDSGNQTEDNGNPSKVKRSKVKKSKDNIKLYSEDFEKFWVEYPNKKGKGKASDSWDKINPSKSLIEKIIKAVKDQRESPDWIKEGGKYIPHPTTWLNQCRWDDEVKKVVGKGNVDKI